MGWPVRLGGKWYGRYRNANGKIVSTRVPRDTEDEARDDANEFERILKLATVDFDPRWTLAQYIDWWCIQEKGAYKSNSMETIKTNLRTHILAYPIAQQILITITREDIIKWFKQVKNRYRTGPSAQERAKRTMSLIMISAINHGHAWALIKTGWPGKVREMQPAQRQLSDHRIMGDGEYDALLAVEKPLLHNLFIRLFMATGCRPQEMYALKPKYFNFDNCTVTISHVAVWGKRDPATGDTLRIVSETKTYYQRTISVDSDDMADLKAYIEAHNIQDDHIIFSRSHMGIAPSGRQVRKEIELTPELLATLGSFSVNNSTFQHGTCYAYGVGKCRCEYCTAAVTQYRRNRRADQPRPETSGRIENRPFERDVLPKSRWIELMRGYLVKAGIDWEDWEPYDFRHTCATWLAEEGTDPYELQYRMGHQNMKTTMGYIHRTKIKRDAVMKLRMRREAFRSTASPSQPLDITKASSEELLAALQVRLAQGG